MKYYRVMKCSYDDAYGLNLDAVAEYLDLADAVDCAKKISDDIVIKRILDIYTADGKCYHKELCQDLRGNDCAVPANGIMIKELNVSDSEMEDARIKALGAICDGSMPSDLLMSEDEIKRLEEIEKDDQIHRSR